MSMISRFSGISYQI